MFVIVLVRAGRAAFIVHKPQPRIYIGNADLITRFKPGPEAVQNIAGFFQRGFRAGKGDAVAAVGYIDTGFIFEVIQVGVLHTKEHGNQVIVIKF